jgi:hypothetical protein
VRVSRLEAENFVHAWRNSNLPKKSWTFLKTIKESHAYPSRPFIAMSHFISFEPLIIPVSNFCLDAVLLSTIHSNHDPASDSHTLSQEQEEEEDHKDLISSQQLVRVLPFHPVLVSPSLS